MYKVDNPTHLHFTVLLAKLVTVHWPPSFESLLLEEVVRLGLGVPVEELVQVALVSIGFWSGHLVQLEINGTCMSVVGGRDEEGGRDGGREE